MNKFFCVICGKEEDPERWTNGKDLLKHRLCQSCKHWHEQDELDKNERGKHGYAIIGGTHYVLCPHTDAQIFRGFGGRKFTIRFNDGYETVCDNLWCQGEVPEGHWRELMPDNAEFVKAN